MWPAKHFTRGPDKVQMHFHFDFAARQILWTLTFAAQLVLLVVLLAATARGAIRGLQPASCSLPCN